MDEYVKTDVIDYLKEQLEMGIELEDPEATKSGKPVNWYEEVILPIELKERYSCGSFAFQESFEQKELHNNKILTK